MYTGAMQMFGYRRSRIVVVSGGPSSASDASGAKDACGAGRGQAGQKIAARLHDMHAKSPRLKSGVDLQSSRFRERLDRRRHGSAN